MELQNIKYKTRNKNIKRYDIKTREEDGWKKGVVRKERREEPGYTQ